MDWLYVLKFQVCSFDDIRCAIYNGLWRFQSHSTTLFCCAAGGFSDQLGNFEHRAILASRSFEQMHQEPVACCSSSWAMSPMSSSPR